MTDQYDSRLDNGIGIAPGFEKGKEIFLSDILTSITVKNNMPDVFGRVGAHEFGHAAGLRHPNDVDNPIKNLPTDNLMTQTKYSRSRALTHDQFKSIHNTFK